MSGDAGRARMLRLGKVKALLRIWEFFELWSIEISLIISEGLRIYSQDLWIYGQDRRPSDFQILPFGPRPKA